MSQARAAKRAKADSIPEKNPDRLSFVTGWGGKGNHCLFQFFDKHMFANVAQTSSVQYENVFIEKTYNLITSLKKFLLHKNIYQKSFTVNVEEEIKCKGHLISKNKKEMICQFPSQEKIQEILLTVDKTSCLHQLINLIEAPLIAYLTEVKEGGISEKLLMPDGLLEPLEFLLKSSLLPAILNQTAQYLLQDVKKELANFLYLFVESRSLTLTINDKFILTRLIKWDVSFHVRTYNSTCYNPPTLHKAVEKNNIEIVKLFFHLADVKINSLDSKGNTPFILCVLYGCVEMAKLLIAKGADVSVVDTNGRDALYVANHLKRIYGECTYHTSRENAEKIIELIENVTVKTSQIKPR